MKTILRKIHIVYLLFAFLFLGSACSPVYYSSDFHGRVIDDDTREPIQGAVALARWYKTYPGPAEMKGEYYDAREAVTDENGFFTIRGKGVRLLTFVSGPAIVIFKAGYDASGADGTEDEAGNVVITLKKLTVEQRKRWSHPPLPPDEAPYEKVKMYLKEINKERLELGYKPLTIWRGEKYE